MRPSDNVDGSYVDDQTGSTATSRATTARKIGKGAAHRSASTYDTNGGGTFYLYDPMVHVELSD